jgi:hypothetical protein
VRSPDRSGSKAPVLLIHAGLRLDGGLRGLYRDPQPIADRRLALLNNCGYSPHLEKPRSCAGPRVPAGPLTLIADEGAWAVI